MILFELEGPPFTSRENAAFRPAYKALRRLVAAPG
jgi:hypothetical protein